MRLCLLGVALFIGGCGASGSPSRGVSPRSNGGASAVGGGASQGGATSSGGVSAGVVPPGTGVQSFVCKDPARIGPTITHRLSRLEYFNAVRDLFGIQVNQGDLPSDEVLNAFVANVQTRMTADNFTRYDTAGKGIATQVTDNFATLSGCSGFDAACVEPFLTSKARRAFHGTLEPEDQQTLLELYRGLAGADPKLATSTAIRWLLGSPRFLFTLDFGTPDGGTARLSASELAGRLAGFLWRSIPDEPLLQAADAGTLATKEGISAQATRLLSDPRSEPVLRSFVNQWLGLVPPAPGAPALEQEMAAESEQVFLSAVQGGMGTFPELLTSTQSRGSAVLATFYGGQATANGALTVPAERQGLLLRAAFLKSHASGVRASPVKRGKQVRISLLCDTVPPPNPVSMMLTDDTKLSDTEVFNQHSASPICGACHKLMDPIGAAFSRFPADGTLDLQNTSSTAGTIFPGSLTPIAETPFVDTADLIRVLATNEHTHQCFALQATRFALSRGETLADGCGLTDIWTAFQASNYNLRSLFLNIATSPLMQKRDIVVPGGKCR